MLEQQETYYGYTGNGVTKTFAFGCRIFYANDLVVKVAGIVKAFSVDYSINGIDDPGGGSVTFYDGRAPGAGQLVEIERILDYKRITGYTLNDNFRAETVDKDQDYQTALIQQLAMSTYAALVQISGGGEYNAAGKRIVNLADPVALTDAVNRQSLVAEVASQSTILAGILTDLLNIYSANGSANANFINMKLNHLLLDRVEPPEVPGVAINPTAGNLNGATTYAVSYVTATGETEVSNLSAVVTPVNQKVTVTIPISADSRVIARRIYRMPIGSWDTVLKYLVAEVADNITITYTDNVLDSALGVGAQRINTTGATLDLNGARVASLGGSSTAYGANAMPGNRGYANDAFGANSLHNNTVGFRNTAIGIFSLYSNTIGALNAAVGVHAMNNNVDGTGNTALGYAALFNNTSGNYSVAVGTNALETATTGGNNVAVGSNALRYVTDASNLVGIGMAAGGGNTTGVINTYVGSSAGNSNDVGSFNTYIGGMSATMAKGSQNTAIGAYALNSNTAGVANICIGAFSGYYETGHRKLFIDCAPRASEAAARQEAILYGEMDTVTPAAQKLYINAKAFVRQNINIQNVPVYSSNANALAGGLVAGDCYRNGANLCIVY